MLPTLKDKPNFTVGLLVAILALIAFKTELSNITISLGFSSISLLSLLTIFIILLFLTSYLFALEYINFGDGEKYIRIFKILSRCANLLYFISMLFPLTIFLAWLFVIIINFIISLIYLITSFNTGNISILLSTITTAITFILTVGTAKRLSERYKVNILVNRSYKELQKSSFEKAMKAYEHEEYSLAIINFYNTIEYLLKRKLIVKKGYPDWLPLRTTVKYALKESLISSHQYENLMKMLDLTFVAMKTNNIKKKDVMNAKETVTTIMEELKG